MACDLALTITTAEVTDEQLRSLLTATVAKAVLDAVLKDRNLPGVATVSGDTVRWSGSSATLSIQNGKVWARGYYDAEKPIAEAVEAGLVAMAGALYDRQIAQQMQRQAGKAPVIQRGLTVEKNGVARQATLFTVNW